MKHTCEQCSKNPVTYDFSICDECAAKGVDREFARIIAFGENRRCLATHPTGVGRHKPIGHEWLGNTEARRAHSYALKNARKP